MEEAEEELLLSFLREWQRKCGVHEPLRENESGYSSLRDSVASRSSSPFYPVTLRDLRLYGASPPVALRREDASPPVDDGQYGCWPEVLNEVQYVQSFPLQSPQEGTTSASPQELSQTKENIVTENDLSDCEHLSIEEAGPKNGHPCMLSPEGPNSPFCWPMRSQMSNPRSSQPMAMGLGHCHGSNSSPVHLEDLSMTEMVVESKAMKLHQEEAFNSETFKSLRKRKARGAFSGGNADGSTAGKSGLCPKMGSFKTPEKNGKSPPTGIVATPSPVKRAYAAAEKRYGKIDRQLFAIPPADEDIEQIVSPYGIKLNSTRRKCLFPYVYRGPEALYPSPLAPTECEEELPENWIEIATGATPVSKHMIRLAERVLSRSQE